MVTSVLAQLMGRAEPMVQQLSAGPRGPGGAVCTTIVPRPASAGCAGRRCCSRGVSLAAGRPRGASGGTGDGADQRLATYGAAVGGTGPNGGRRGEREAGIEGRQIGHYRNACHGRLARPCVDAEHWQASCQWHPLLQCNHAGCHHRGCRPGRVRGGHCAGRIRLGRDADRAGIGSRATRCAANASARWGSRPLGGWGSASAWPMPGRCG